MLITFSGLDGAGKSTVTQWLRAELERDQYPTTVLHMNDHVGIYAYLRALRDRLLGRADQGEPPRVDSRTTGLGRIRDAVLWSKALRRLLFPFDLLIFWCYRGYIETLRRRILIMDRYFYDSLVDVAGERGWSLLRFLARLTPTPDVSVLMDISPEEAFARKGEYTIPYLRDRHAAYHRVFPWIPTALRLPAGEWDTVRHVVGRAVRERLPR